MRPSGTAHSDSSRTPICAKDPCMGPSSHDRARTSRASLSSKQSCKHCHAGRKSAYACTGHASTTRIVLAIVDQSQRDATCSHCACIMHCLAQVTRASVISLHHASCAASALQCRECSAVTDEPFNGCVYGELKRGMWSRMSDIAPCQCNRTIRHQCMSHHSHCNMQSEHQQCGLHDCEQTHRQSFSVTYPEQ
jgi:hypothetical protein